MAFFKIQTAQGEIGVSRNVIEQIVQDVMEPLDGKAWLSNSKGKTVSKVMRLSGADDADFMEISTGAGGLELRMYIVVRFGTSIQMITGRIIENVQKELALYLGEPAAKIAVVVSGVVSSRMARRNIEVKSERGER